jgi:hypothetical protein
VEKPNAYGEWVIFSGKQGRADSPGPLDEEVLVAARPTMRFGHPQIRQQEGHRFGRHGGATIGVQRKLPRLNMLFLATFLD